MHSFFTGKAETKLCPDGLVFSDANSNKELCDIPSNVDCGDRKELRTYKNNELKNSQKTLKTCGTCKELLLIILLFTFRGAKA